MTLPDDFAVSLPNVTRLSLAQNRLVLLPDNLGDMRSLGKLDVYKNQLTVSPLTLNRLKQHS